MALPFDGFFKRYSPLLAGTIIIVILDQLTKVLVREHIELYQAVPVIQGFFNLTHIQNPGAAFGFLAGVGERWVGLFFIGLTIFASVVLVYLYKQALNEGVLLRIALTLILGGALGNLVDRFTVGTVTDFLDFYIGNFHWWAFNVADSCITVGAVMAIAASLFDQKREEKAAS